MFALAALLCFAIAFPVRILLLRSNIIDRPNDRSSHSQITVRGGGIAILLSFIVVVVSSQHTRDNGLIWIFLASAVILAVVSFIDDMRPLPVSVRFGFHGLTAVVALCALERRLNISTEGIYHPTILLGAGGVLLFLWITGYTNAFNFMDGINGIAASQAMVTAAGSGIIAGIVSQRWEDPAVIFAFALSGSAAGFLPHNVPHARMFMGDVGSAPLGFILATLALWLAGVYGMWLLAPLLLLHANFVLDTGITLVRRIAKNERWRESHREHFYQRLVRSGKTHNFVSGWEIALEISVLGMMLVYVKIRSPCLHVVLAATVVSLWLLFFCYSEYQFRRIGPSRL